jgi:hypothetical protein
MFSQADADRADIGFEFRANMLFSEQGAAAVGVPYLIPTADRIEARLTGADGSDLVSPVVQPLERVTTDNHAVATVIEFESVPVNIAYTISLRIFSSADPGETLHSGSADIAPITGTEREKEVTVRLDPGVVEADRIEESSAKNVSPDRGTFLLYRLDTDLRPSEPHALSVTGNPDLEGIRVQVLNSGFRGSLAVFSDVGAGRQASLPASAEPYYIAVYREEDAPAGTVNLELSLSSTASSESIITVTNPGVPVFTMDTGGFSIDASVSQEQLITVTSTETITGYTWFINGDVVLTGPAEDQLTVQAIWANDPGNPTVLGSNTLTLVVEIDGLPYSSDFFFTVVEE